MGNKKIWQILLCILLISMFACPASAQTQTGNGNSYVTIYVYGQPLVTDVPGAIVNDNVLIPFRPLLEKLGAQVVWDDDFSSVTATKGKTELTLVVNSKVAWINKQKVDLTIAPMMISGRVMVPVRFISQNLGEPVRWDATARSVYVGETRAPEDTSWTQEQVLTQDTSLAYMTGQKAVFMAGTKVNFRAKGLVSSGILKENTILPQNQRVGNNLTFKAGTQVAFNDGGYVSQGMLAYDCKVEYAPFDNISLDMIPSRTRNQVLIKKDTQITMDKDGYLVKGILAGDTDLLYSKDRLVSLKEITEVTFAGGWVVKGTLKDKSNLPTDATRQAVFKGGTTVEIVNSKVVKGTLGDDCEMVYASGYSKNWAIFAEDSLVELDENGLVKRGTLAEDTQLFYKANSYLTFMEDKPVEFFSNGMVMNGYLKNASTLQISPVLSKTYAPHTLITFSINGYVTNGTLVP